MRVNECADGSCVARLPNHRINFRAAVIAGRPAGALREGWPGGICALLGRPRARRREDAPDDDDDAAQHAWRDAGECERNDGFMRKFCHRTCRGRDATRAALVADEHVPREYGGKGEWAPYDSPEERQLWAHVREVNARAEVETCI